MSLYVVIIGVFGRNGTIEFVPPRADISVVLDGCNGSLFLSLFSSVLAAAVLVTAAEVFVVVAVLIVIGTCTMVAPDFVVVEAVLFISSPPSRLSGAVLL